MSHYQTGLLQATLDARVLEPVSEYKAQTHSAYVDTYVNTRGYCTLSSHAERVIYDSERKVSHVSCNIALNPKVCVKIFFDIFTFLIMKTQSW